MFMAKHGSGFLNKCQAANVRFSLNARPRPFLYNPNVLDWYLKQWLETLQVSQAELSRRTDYPKAKVSDLVTGKQRYNRDVLNDVAAALHLHPYEVLMHPDDAMAQRRLRRAAESIVNIPYGGTAGGGEEDTATSSAA